MAPFVTKIAFQTQILFEAPAGPWVGQQLSVAGGGRGQTLDDERGREQPPNVVKPVPALQFKV